MTNLPPIYIIFHGRFPSEKAAALFAAKEAESFAALGYAVTLLVPRRFGRSGDYRALYDIKTPFTVTYLPTVDLFPWRMFRRIAFLSSVVAFSVSVACYLFVRSARRSIVYSNENVPLYLASFIRRNAFYEMHDFPERSFRFYRFFLRRIRGVVIHNTWKAQKTTEILAIPEGRILVELSAADVAAFDLRLEPRAARERLNIVAIGPVIVYTGHLYNWKGADTLAEAAKLVPLATFYFVGGTSSDVETYRTRFAEVPNVRFVGHRPHGEIALWQQAADVLVIPNTATQAISKYYTSPMKLYEYMASRRPIVATDIPSIREVLPDDSGFFCAPDDPVDMARVINEALHDRVRSERCVARAFRVVASHTWYERARRVLAFISSKLG